MITPAGAECPYYFADYYRGRNKQECRLIDQTPEGGKWTPDHCSRCRIPRIALANACPNLVLEAKASPGLLGFGKRVNISARCTRKLETVKVPEIGCGLCHLPLNAELPPEEGS